MDNCSATETLLSLDQALVRMSSAVQPLTDSEWVPLRAALQRVVATDLVTPIDLPRFDNTAMDGYAVRSADLPIGGLRLRQLGTAFAGRPWDGSLPPGGCVRIFTGAPLPSGSDAVVMQEDTEDLGPARGVEFQRPPQSGDYVRRSGEDFRAGDIIICRGERITPAHLGVLAACGIATVPVTRRVRVAYLATGDELRPLGQPLRAGEIYGSNRYSLWGLISEAGAEPSDLGSVNDDPAALRERLLGAARNYDLLITTGGASVGAADCVTSVLQQLGHVQVWKVAIRPGKPTVFGTIGAIPVCGLPGNPGAVITAFLELVRPLLWTLEGALSRQPLRVQATLTETIHKSADSLEFHRGIARPTGAGSLTVRACGGLGSHRLRPLTAANCFILLPASRTRADAGETVEIEFWGTVI